MMKNRFLIAGLFAAALILGAEPARSQAQKKLALVGGILRGGSIFALNNEHLAAFLETAIAVSAPKGTEKIAWCVATCGEAAKGGAAKDDRDAAFLPMVDSGSVELEVAR